MPPALRLVIGLGILVSLVGQPGTLRAGKPGISDRVQEARTVLERFLKLEEQEEYEQSYDLLSSKIRAALEKESGIRNRREYKKARKFQGLRWHSARIMQTEVANGGRAVGFGLEIIYEQPIIGERVATDRITILVIMVMERGRWFVDAWTGS